MKNIKLWASLAAPLCILFFGPFLFDHFTLVEIRMLAILVMALLFWVMEPIPIFATSMLIVASEIFLISNNAPVWLRSSTENHPIGNLIPYQSILQTLASPIIILFLGGFFLAMAATKYKLDINLARVLIKPFGTNPKFVILGTMTITAVFSMFMSNTATTAMMLAVLTPVFSQMDAKDPGKIAFLIAIPFAANIGGMGTPIGTPPNVVALKYLIGENSISFGQWMLFGVPLVMVLVLLTWQILLAVFRPSESKITINIQEKFQKSTKAYIVYALFILTICLWLTEFLHGVNSYSVSMLPIAVFLATKVITKEDLKKINWDVLWFISGGIALGLGLEESQLLNKFIATIPFDYFPAVVIVVVGTLLAVFMSTIMSNTATANLLLPIIATLGATVPSIASIGGTKILVLLVALSCSLGMALPISTPPNALAYSSGGFESQAMLKVGSIVSVIGMLVLYLLAYILLRVML